MISDAELNNYKTLRETLLLAAGKLELVGQTILAVSKKMTEDPRFIMVMATGLQADKASAELKFLASDIAEMLALFDVSVDV